MNNRKFSRRRLLKLFGGAALFGVATLYAKRSFGGNAIIMAPKVIILMAKFSSTPMACHRANFQTC